MMISGSESPSYIQNILIVENKKLLGASIQSLLASMNFNVCGIMPQNERDLLEAIWFVRPDVMILDKDSQLTSPTRLLNQLKTYPNLRLIVVNANAHTMKIYDQKELKASSTASLALAIEMAQREIFNNPYSFGMAW